jgi:hypothetical protein
VYWISTPTVGKGGVTGIKDLMRERNRPVLPFEYQVMAARLSCHFLTASSCRIPKETLHCIVTPVDSPPGKAVALPQEGAYKRDQRILEIRAVPVDAVDEIDLAPARVR